MLKCSQDCDSLTSARLGWVNLHTEIKGCDFENGLRLSNLDNIEGLC